MNRPVTYIHHRFLCTTRSHIKTDPAYPWLRTDDSITFIGDASTFLSMPDVAEPLSWFQEGRKRYIPWEQSTSAVGAADELSLTAVHTTNF